MEKLLPDWEAILKVVDEIAQLQQAKVLSCARRIVPNITTDDILQPNDFPQLENHPHFRYEEGVLEGVRTVQMALQALPKLNAK